MSELGIISLTSVLVVLAGFISGLTLGFMGLDISQLEILKSVQTNDKETQKIASYASKIAPLRKSGNLLLCSLVLINVPLKTGVSILLAELTSGLVGFLLATGLILVFGEITPQAIFSRYGLNLCSKVVWLVKLLMNLVYLVAKPMSLTLDWALKEDKGSVLNKDQMKAMFTLYSQQLNQREIKMLTSTLDFPQKKAKVAMKPVEKTFMINAANSMDEDLIKEIYNKGFSRMPVYKESINNVIGVLLAKDLMFLGKEKAQKMWNFKSMFLRDPLFVSPNESLKKVMQKFLKNSTHLGIVREKEFHNQVTEKVVGIITLEDIIENLIAEEIQDEGDLKRIPSDPYSLNPVLFNTPLSYVSQEELLAVAKFMSKNLPPFSKNLISKANLHQLVTPSNVILTEDNHSEFDSNNIDLEFPNELEDSPLKNVLFESGQQVEDFYLVLSGLVEADFGGMKCQLGPFKTLAMNCLLEETFISTYTAQAKVPSRLLRISKSQYFALRSS